MKNILIGLSCEKKNNKLTVSEDIIFALAEHGAIGVPLPYKVVNQNDNMLLDVCNGFLFCGGGDIHPSLYGEKLSGEEKNICFDRDVFEKTIFEFAFDSGKPILAICRGMQAINVFLGGNLHSHIEGHSQVEKRSVKTHGVRLSKQGLLYNLTGRESFDVNSFHHQAIKKLADGLIVDAVSKNDGYVEAFHHSSHNFLLGIQWHPECLECDISESIFKGFIDACKQ